MVIIMDPDATAENIKSVISVINGAGLEAKVMDGAAQRRSRSRRATSSQVANFIRSRALSMSLALRSAMARPLS